MKKVAFTLAETLITLTIIGVIAAITIPTLLSKYQKHTYVVGLKKAYAELKTALQIMPVSEGCSTNDLECTGFISGTPEQRIELLSKQFKTVKIIKEDENNDTGCNNFSALDNGGFTSPPCFYTADGKIFSVSNNTNYPDIAVDINGLNGPNKSGRDIFLFVTATQLQNDVEQGTLMPMGSKLVAKYYGSDSNHWKDKCTTENVNSDYYHYYASSCAGRVLEEDAMNY